MAIENLQKADGGIAGRGGPAFVFLEGAPSSANDPAGLFLRQSQLLGTDRTRAA